MDLYCAPTILSSVAGNGSKAVCPGVVGKADYIPFSAHRVQGMTCEWVTDKWELEERFIEDEKVRT